MIHRPRRGNTRKHNTHTHIKHMHGQDKTSEKVMEKR